MNLNLIFGKFMVIVAQFQEASSTLLYTATLSTESMKSNKSQTRAHIHVHTLQCYILYTPHVNYTGTRPTPRLGDILSHIFDRNVTKFTPVCEPAQWFLNSWDMEH